MFLSFNLLKKYVDLPKSVTAHEVGLKLTESVIEVEEVKSQAENLDNIVVGKIEKILSHPNADKLRLADVSVGKKVKHVVCGGTNLREGMLVAFAGVGARVRWHGEGDLIELEPAVIRGEKSEGMICAANEIGLSQLYPHAEDEILDLGDEGYKVGENLAVALSLDDEIIEIDNKSITNRPDLWNHFGIARELATIYDVDLREPKMNEIIEVKGSKFNELEIDIKNKELCKRYLAAVVNNVTIAPSPEWMQQVLQASGIKSINNIVDITNFVMIELGQPLHAFDKDKIGGKIIVRNAEKEEKIITLDEEEQELDKDMLVIANEKEPIAVAGVMGGHLSGIGNETKTVVFEAANFDGISVRKTSASIGLRTESSMRFEKQLDTHLAERAIRRALELIREVVPGAEIVGNILQAGKAEDKEVIIDISLKKLNALIGTDLSSNKVVGILERQGFIIVRRVSPEGSDDVIFKVQVPSWRATGDIKIAEDVIEEVARIYGYGKIEARMPVVEARPWQPDEIKKKIDKTKEILSLGAGMEEVYNYAFLSENVLGKLGIEKEASLKLENPLSEDLAYLRTNLVAGLLRNVKDNARYNERFKLFEIGRVFVSSDGEYAIAEGSKQMLPHQPYYVGGVVVDKKEEMFLAAKGIVEKLIKELRLFEIELVGPQEGEKWPEGATDQNNLIIPEKSLSLVLKGEKVGWIATYSPLALRAFRIKNRKVSGFEIDLSRVAELAEGKIDKFAEIPKYPSVERDIAVEVEKHVRWGDIVSAVEGIDPLVKRVEFLSEYNLEEKKSLAFRVIYLDESKTLEEVQVEKVQKKIVEKLKSEFGAELRA